MSPTTPLQRQNNRRAPTRRTNTRTRYQIAAPLVAPRAFPVVGVLTQVPRVKWFALLLITVLTALLVLFFNTDWFYVYDVEVSGMRSLTRKEVEKASGIVGWNIFFIEPSQVQTYVATLPEVKAVEVGTALPNRVTIHIVERLPEVIWIRGNENYWVADDGMIMLARAPRPELVVIRDLDFRAMVIGKRAPLDAFAAQRALRQVWRDAPRAFDWSRARGLAFTDERGWKIYLGDASEMAGKLARYRALVATLIAQNKRVNFIDLGKGDPFYQ
ncbi:MAG: FtsQ-type POTRA domain-containing protein [Chloroflexi bacterium]|nr:FtsQ-type POTRA domain-containing protein [Chloroflexota bacterium]